MDNINFNTFYTVTKNHLVEQLKQEKIEKRREQIIKLKSQNAALVMNEMQSLLLKFYSLFSQLH